jgi:carbonic anhydrase
MGIQRLVEGHRRFVETFARAQSDYLRQLATEGQSPDTFMVSCADSRVIPELITGAAPGHLFVVRNVANMVPPYKERNMTVGSALEYALTALGVKHIVVLGHYGCGGMAAVRKLFGPGSLSEKGSIPDTPLYTWLKYAEPSYHEAVQKGVLDSEEWLETLIEENVLQQLAHIIEYPHVREKVAEGALTLHAWTYALDEARLYFFDAASARFVPSDEAPAHHPAGELSIAEIEREDHVR